MQHSEFDEMLEDVFGRVRNVLASKSAEYAADTDKLHNFKKAANLQGISDMEALGGMLAKHVISVFDMIGDAAPHPIEQWDEKLTDAINYLILLRAIVVESNGKAS